MMKGKKRERLMDERKENSYQGGQDVKEIMIRDVWSKK